MAYAPTRLPSAVMGYDPAADHKQFPFPGDNHLALLADAGVGTNIVERIDIRGLSVQEALHPFNPKRLQLGIPLFSGGETGITTMAKRSADLVSRRVFLHGATALGGSALLAKGFALGSESTGKSDLPRRVLGKTKEKVPVLALGTAPCGQSKTVDTRSVIAIVNEALDLGVNYLDSARIYGNSEEAIGKALRGRRHEAFLTTKVWADDAEKARKSFEQSLRELQTDFVDLVFLHSVGNREVDRVTAEDGALKYLLGQKEAGKARFVGISGHSRSPSFIPLLESGDIDVAMIAMNFVDRYTYKFESQVLPVANKHNVGVACMKVFWREYAAASANTPAPIQGRKWPKNIFRMLYATRWNFRASRRS